MKLKFTHKTWYFFLLCAAAASMLNGFAVLGGMDFSFLEMVAFCITGITLLFLAAEKGSSAKDKRNYFGLFVVLMLSYMGRGWAAYICSALVWPGLLGYEYQKGRPIQRQLQLVGAALLVGFAVSLLWSEAQLVELNSQIQSAKAELVSEQSQYTYYNSALNSRTNITSVEETATRLGLMKIDQSQITYIRLDEGSVLVRKASAVRQWSDLLHDGAMTILASVRTAK